MAREICQCVPNFTTIVQIKRVALVGFDKKIKMKKKWNKKPSCR